MPAAVLVLIVLASIVFDQSHVFTAQRELVSDAQAAANDAAGAGLDEVSFYRGDQIRFDLARARAAADEALRARGVVEQADVELSSDGSRVEVTVRAEVAYLFARAVPGVHRSTWVTARAEASLRTG